MEFDPKYLEAEQLLRRLHADHKDTPPHERRAFDLADSEAEILELAGIDVSNPTSLWRELSRIDDEKAARANAASADDLAAMQSDEADLVATIARLRREADRLADELRGAESDHRNLAERLQTVQAARKEIRNLLPAFVQRAIRELQAECNRVGDPAEQAALGREIDALTERVIASPQWWDGVSVA
jgi:chromosome segregation ATPase